MVFSMCNRSKKSTQNVIEPTKQQSASPAPRSSSPMRKSKKSRRSSSSNPSFSTGGSDNFATASLPSTASFYIDSSRSTSISGAASLHSLRDSVLPEQAYVYSFQEISAATRGFLLQPHFSSSSSTAWRCRVRDQTGIIFQRKFRREIDTEHLVDRLALICRSHHSSLVKLKGASISGLGFEFVHNHIKSSSIIIEEPLLNAKLCHFGTSELCGEITKHTPVSKEAKRLHSKMNKFEGTRGYMAPEFQQSGTATQKGDVYAFGVVILELLSGMEALEYRMNSDKGTFVRISVVDTARQAVEVEGGVRKWVDKRLKDSYPEEVVGRLARLALDCVADDPERRPDMNKVVGKISQMFLESQKWSETMVGGTTDFTNSLVPR
ncbi:lysM domain receptor-like kinase 3 [Andrographis paniculata]|uniref:lysM domain receptor-like kinase 3 n=1 Tax=Andrographis paniculata TaxID=175694 RepID=UPI0021E74B36|nr:lysM domain receptor-like kinase 3 [Andrographis paniculata]